MNKNFIKKIKVRFNKINSKKESDTILSKKNDIEIYSEGFGSKICVTGANTKIYSKGNSSDILLSGIREHIISTGVCSNISGDISWGSIKSTGNRTKINIDGHKLKIEIEGKESQLHSIAKNTKIDIKGDDCVAFISGFGSIVKAKKGTKITLAEFDTENKYIPKSEKPIQIGNEKYKDCNGDVLREDTYYSLVDGKILKVITHNGENMGVISEKQKGDMTIIKCIDLEYYTRSETPIRYIVKRRRICYVWIYT